MSAIGDLVATMGMNIAPWQASLATAGGSLVAFQTRTHAVLSRIRGSMGALAGSFGVGLSAVGLVATAKASLELLDTTGKLADRLGMTTERIGGLRHAAEMSGASVDQLDASLEKMTRYVGEAALGTAQARDTLDTLGIPLQTLLAMDPDERFAEISEAIRGMRTEEERTAVAQRIFGRGASELMNTLVLGKGKLAEFQTEAERLGKTFSDDVAKQAAAADDAIARLTGALKGSTVKVVGEFADEIEAVADALAKIPQEFRNIRANLLDFAKPGGVGQDLMRAARGDLAAIQRLMTGQERELTEWEQNLADRITEEQNRLRAGIPFTTPPVDMEAMAEKERQAKTAALSATMQETIGGPFGELMQRLTAAGMEKAKGAVGDVVEAHKDRQALLARGRELAEIVETPMEEFQRRMAELERLRGGVFPAISAETAARLEDRYKTELGERLGVDDTFDELPGVLERGTDAAWSKIVSAMYTPEKQDVNEKVADNTQRAAAALERIEAKEPEEAFEIGV